MTVRVGINGFGRIGRNFFRAVLAQKADVDVVAVNDLGDPATMAHLLAYDSVLGRFPGKVNFADGVIQAGNHSFRDAVGIDSGMMTTVHAYTQDQNLQDAPHQDLRRARAAALNIVPTSSGAAKAIGLVLPERVPVPNGSVTDLTVTTTRPTTVKEVNQAYAAAAAGAYKGLLSYADAPLVSSDIVGDPASCVFDSALTRALDAQVKVIGWYDNEWGYSNRLVDLSLLVGSTL
jgi:glyceraldehyde-3-phosphate dehydrogenase/erythrose-4-phosphate dehydrogenase